MTSRNSRPGDRVAYYKRVCESLGLNPFTRPFQYIKFNNKLTLYASKDATDQLRALKGITIESCEWETLGEAYVVTVTAVDAKGRRDTDLGAVEIEGLKGEDLSNASNEGHDQGQAPCYPLPRGPRLARRV